MPTIPVIKMNFAPVQGGRLPLPPRVPITTQRVTIETPYGFYAALVRVDRGMELLVESIRKESV